MHALIVEDTQQRIDSYIKANPGWQISYTPDPERAITLLKSSPKTFDLVCLDYNLIVRNTTFSKRSSPGFTTTETVASFLSQSKFRGEVLIHTLSPLGAGYLFNTLVAADYHPYCIPGAWHFPDLFSWICRSYPHP